MGRNVFWQNHRRGVVIGLLFLGTVLYIGSYHSSPIKLQSSYRQQLVAADKYACETEINSFTHRLELNAQNKMRERLAWFQAEKFGAFYKKVSLFNGNYYFLFTPYYPCLWSFTKQPRADQLIDGAKWTCGLEEIESHRKLYTEPKQCVVYSFGSFGAYHFEERVKEVAPSCEIHTFDPREYKNSPSFVKFHYSFGLSGAHEGIKIGEMEYKTKTLVEFMGENRHQYIDILKMDVEMSEWSVIKNTDWSKLNIGQILVELHPEKDMMVEDLHDYLSILEDAGFRLISLEPVFAGSNQVEVVLIHKNWNPRNGRQL